MSDETIKRLFVGDAGHHVPSVRKSRGRVFEVSRLDKSRPTIFPKGEDADICTGDCTKRKDSLSDRDRAISTGRTKNFSRLTETLIEI